MDEKAFAKALIDAGLFKVLGVFVSTPFGILILIEVAKFFGFRKNKRTEEVEKEEFKCKLYSQEQAFLKEYICKFDEERADHLSEVRDKVLHTNMSIRQLLADLREDRKIMVQLVKIISKKIGGSHGDES